jgi:hypothetical protein
MLLHLRRLKHDEFMSDRFRRYVGYAVGELLLVVAGILIALQIDNWNEDRKERATLQSYLESIARNVREDQAELEPLRAHRAELMYLASRFDLIRNVDRFSVEEVELVNRIWSLAATQSFFSANTSGFEALKSSGVLNRLQGSDIEQLLSRYYDHIKQVELLENGLDDTLRPLLTELRMAQPEELLSWAILNPSGLTPEQFEVSQPYFAELIRSPTMGAVIDALFGNQALILHYDSLAVLGESFSLAVEAGELESPVPMVRTPLDDIRDNLGPAVFVADGRPLAENYFLTTTTPPGRWIFRLESVERRDGALHIDWTGGAEWAAVYWSNVHGNTATGRSAMDMTRFSKLVLELRGDRGGEVLQVHIKDADYPDDRPPVSVDVTLTTDWETFEIDLAEFAPNDLSRIHVGLGLLIFPAQEPLSYSIRNARYE